VKLVESSNTQLLLNPDVHVSVNVEKAIDFNGSLDGKDSKASDAKDDEHKAKKAKRKGDGGATQCRAVIEGSTTFHYELVEIMPKLDLLRTLLAKTAYGMERSGEEKRKKRKQRKKRNENRQRNEYRERKRQKTTSFVVFF